MSKSVKKPMAITKKDVNNKDRKQLTRPPKEYTQEEQRLIDAYLTRSKMKLLKHKGGQAIVGSLTQREDIKIKNEKQSQGKWVLNNGNKPLDLRALPRCQATAKSTGRRCGNPAMKNKEDFYLHGGKSPGAPRGNRNALKHRFYTARAITERPCVRMLHKRSKDLLAELRY